MTPGGAGAARRAVVRGMPGRWSDGAGRADVVPGDQSRPYPAPLHARRPRRGRQPQSRSRGPAGVPGGPPAAAGQGDDGAAVRRQDRAVRAGRGVAAPEAGPDHRRQARSRADAAAGSHAGHRRLSRGPCLHGRVEARREPVPEEPTAGEFGGLRRAPEGFGLPRRALDRALRRAPHRGAAADHGHARVGDQRRAALGEARAEPQGRRLARRATPAGGDLPGDGA